MPTPNFTMRLEVNLRDLIREAIRLARQPGGKERLEAFLADAMASNPISRPSLFEDRLASVEERLANLESHLSQLAMHNAMHPAMQPSLPLDEGQGPMQGNAIQSAMQSSLDDQQAFLQGKARQHAMQSEGTQETAQEPIPGLSEAGQDKPLAEGFGSFLKASRQTRGISQRALAGLAKMDRSLISQIETGKRESTSEQQRRLTEALRT